MNDTLVEALNRQVNAELYSSYLYLSMSAWFSDQGLHGFANWMRVQADEERFHAMKMFDYVLERGGRVTLTAIDAPPTDWETPLAVIQDTLAHEQHVTSLINDLMNLAQSEKDHAMLAFLQWFITEQVEEEASAQEILDKVNLVKDGGMLFALDKDLSTRVFTPPAP